MMSQKAGISLQELRVDGGPTKNQFLMQFQADMLQATISRSNIEEASALGAVIMNGLARKVWNNFQEVANLCAAKKYIYPHMDKARARSFHNGWCEAVKNVISIYK